MNIVLKYILTNLKERKLRTAVMLLSIPLSSMLLFVSFSIGESYESAQQKMARGMAGSATLAVSSADGTGLVPADAIPALPSIRASAGVLEASALYKENGYYETIDLVAAPLSQLNQINPPRLKNGGELSGFSGSRILLPDRFTSKYGIEKGDTITLQIKGNPISFEVADIASYDTVFLRHTRGATALLPLETLSGLLGEGEGFSRILLEPADGVSTASLKQELEAALPDGAYRVTEIVNEARIAADARQKSMPFFLISFFSLTMSVFIIFSSYKVITLDRLPVIGTFRSIGATRKTVSRILLLESLLYGCAGGLLGIPPGILVLYFLLQGMGENLSQGMEIPIVISVYGLFSSFAVAVTVSLLSAWIPVHRASRLPVKEVVLGNVEEEPVSRPLVLITGAALFFLSVILPKAAPENLLYPAGALSLLGLLCAAIMLIPLLTNAASRSLEFLYGFFPGNECRLAARNMRDNKNVTQNVTLLFISISAVIVIRVVGSFVTTYVSDVFNGAELEGFADGMMDQAFVDEVKAMDGVEKVLPLYVFNGKLQGNGIPFSRLEATSNLEWYNTMFALHYTGQEEKEQAEAVFGSGRAIILSEDRMKQAGLSPGDTIRLSDGASEKDYTVAGSFKSRATDVEAVIPSDCAVTDFSPSSYGFLAYTAADPEAVMIQIRDLFADTPNWSRTVEEFNTDALSTVGAFLQPMHSMTYFILLLAAIGVINNLLINYMQKRRSIAMYKSVGLSCRQNRKMTLTEGFSSGLLGALIAMFVSYQEIQTIFLVAGPKISMVPRLEASSFLTAGMLGILVTLLGSVVPIWKSRRMNLIQEIKFE